MAPSAAVATCVPTTTPSASPTAYYNSPKPSKIKYLSSVSPSSVVYSVSHHIFSLVTCRDRRQAKPCAEPPPPPPPLSTTSSVDCDWRAEVYDTSPNCMRAEQSVCLNCRGLFFSDLVCIADDFCSLDCHACFQYAFHMQQEVDHSLGVSVPGLDESSQVSM